MPQESSHDKSTNGLGRCLSDINKFCTMEVLVILIKKNTKFQIIGTVSYTPNRLWKKTTSCKLNVTLTSLLRDSSKTI